MKIPTPIVIEGATWSTEAVALLNDCINPIVRARIITLTLGLATFDNHPNVVYVSNVKTAIKLFLRDECT